MYNKTFGELTFNTGWKTKTEITIYGTNYNIVVKAKAYYESDGVTAEQESAYADFKENIGTRLITVEKLLDAFTDGNFANRFTPQTLLIQRNGEYALLLDDRKNEDGGIAVILAPIAEVKSQDEYL